MPDTSRLRALVSRLNTAPPRKDRPPVRLTRKNRRVLLVLLSGSPKLFGATIMQAAQVRSGPAWVLLKQLERIGWAERQHHPRYVQGIFAGTYRTAYHLTPKGRSEAARLLGLDLPGDPPAMMPAPVAEAEGTP